MPIAAFPQVVSTGFLVPSWTTKPVIKRKILLSEAEDYTRVGRIKSGVKMGFDFVFKGRSVEEYTTLLAFWTEQAYHIPFTWYDPVRMVTHTLYFDSTIEAEYADHSLFNFNVKVTE